MCVFKGSTSVGKCGGSEGAPSRFATPPRASDRLSALGERLAAHVARLAGEDGDGLHGGRAVQRDGCAVERALGRGLRTVGGVADLCAFRAADADFGARRERGGTADSRSLHGLQRVDVDELGLLQELTAGDVLLGADLSSR